MIRSVWHTAERRLTLNFDGPKFHFEPLIGIGSVDFRGQGGFGVANASISGGLVKTGTALSQEQVRDLEELARERQLPVSAVLREAVRLYLIKNRPKASAIPA